jgi:hypothetical protein
MDGQLQLPLLLLLLRVCDLHSLMAWQAQQVNRGEAIMATSVVCHNDDMLSSLAPDDVLPAV